MSDITDPDVLFFYEHAGSSYDPATETPEQGRRRGAEALADAEKWAKANGYSLWREPDDAGTVHATEYPDAYDAEPERCEVFTLRDEDGAIVQSLGCVDDASDEYARVVWAELALEEMPTDAVVPDDYPVRPVFYNGPGIARCGTCHRRWDDSKSTGMTPVPSGRCPFEQFHVEPAEEGETLVSLLDSVEQWESYVEIHGTEQWQGQEMAVEILRRTAEYLRGMNA